MINRSGIEVAVHAEASLPVVLVPERYRVAARRARTGGEISGRRRHAVDLRIGNIETQIGVRANVPLGARTDPPGREVVVATCGGQGSGALEAVARLPCCRYRKSRQSSRQGILRRAPTVIGGTVIAHRVITTMHRRAPRLAPEWLVGEIEAPSGGQLNRGRSAIADGTAIDAIREDAVGNALAMRQPIVAVRVLEQVTQRASAVVNLTPDVVASAYVRRVDLQAGTNRVAPRVARVTRDFVGLHESGRRSGRIDIEVVVVGVDLMQGAHDLGRPPRLVDADVADDIRHLPAAVRASAADS